MKMYHSRLRQLAAKIIRDLLCQEPVQHDSEFGIHSKGSGEAVRKFK